MMEDIYNHDNPALDSLDDEPTPLRCHICSHPICPIWAADEAEPGWSEANRLVTTNARGQFKSCAMFKPKALGALNFLARMGICASAILALCTVFQVHLVVTVALGCSSVAFWQLWRWLEGKKHL